MADLKCPYCPETRPSRSRLVTHLNATHLDIPSAARYASVDTARTVEDVPVAGTELAEQPPAEGARVVQCVCGAPIEPLDESTEYPDWTHVFPMPKCRDAIPAAGMPTKADRMMLSDQWGRVGDKLGQAGREMAEMRAALDAVDERMRKLDAQLTSPATVRRATLNQVWDRLLDAGDLAGAAIVMKMIKAVVDDQ